MIKLQRNPSVLRRLALEHADKTISIMQLYADVDAETEIGRSVFASPVRAWREITEDEAKRIRDARPKPKPAEPLADIPDDASIDELRDKIRQLAAHTLGIAQAHDDMVKRIAQIESTPIVDGIERIEDR